ncbi:nucleotide cyclase [Dunaliella salina]|uniref:Nucleotide cyclase n=1 Tax=Dunaliella salina TaxID=3046 RepID=A0ABQ7G2T5_DUNSA|nr:nucleotide cyclase [Dunaliella salina]|eukprot:KAF5828909.1 nucleotide cyclase [Dunaliella salina]
MQLARQTLRSATISLDKSMGNGKEVEKKLGRPPPPAPAAIPMPATLTVRESLQFKWHPVAPDQPGATLVFRGLRVRMGINSGILSAADSKLNKAAGRMHYTGRSLGYAKAISDAACGGMILLGNDTHERLSMHSLLEHVMTLHLGEHMLCKDAPVMSLHQIIARPLMGRLLLLAPISSIRQHGLGVLDAPAGVVTVAFMSVVNEGALMNWNLNIASEAFALFQEHVCTMLFKHGGYLVESNDGLVLASFAKHSSALRWAVQCMQQMHKIHWPEELMSYEASMATQPMVKDTMTMGPVVQDQATGQTASHANHANLQHRGLRIKVGLDCGKLKGEINCVTGRMAYRGKYMNRASRIASIARPGQVLASADVWNACQPQAMQKKLCASSLGHFNLKGVASPLEIFSVT